MNDVHLFPRGFMKRAVRAIGSVDELRFVDTLVRNLDPTGSRKIPQGASLYVRGWALVPGPPRLGRAVMVSVGSGPRFEAKYWKPRPDIATHFQDPDVAACGFVGISSLAGLAVGKHEVVISLVDGTDGMYELARERFSVTPSSDLISGKTRLEDGRMVVAIDEVATLRQAGPFDGKKISTVVGDVVFVRGWAVDRTAGVGLGGIIGVLDDDHYTIGVHGLPRVDAAAAVDLPKARRCGFTLRIPTTGMKPGAHTLDLAILSADTSEYLKFSIGIVELASM